MVPNIKNIIHVVCTKFRISRSPSSYIYIKNPTEVLGSSIGLVHIYMYSESHSRTRMSRGTSFLP